MLLLDRANGCNGTESWNGINRGAQAYGNEHIGGQSEDVKRREDVEELLTRINIQRMNAIHAVAVQIAIGQFHSLGFGRRTRGVENDGGVIGIDGRRRRKAAERAKSIPA